MSCSASCEHVLIHFPQVDRGWSVRTTIYIERHKFVCEYIGQVLTVDEAFMKNMPSTYQFQMDGAGEHKLKFVVDAFKCGNEARFINHSCSPNLDVRPVFADRLDECYHRIAFFAKRDIKIGEELTIDYCAIDGNAQGRQKTECTCRALKCRGFFYY
uniref:Histone-lysine N-methyltransferase n=1 Tax=Globodera pallida TaxID=36090 RepID=A0A183CBV4_GLOPA